ncbi:MAG: hypothetical protein ACI8RA_000804 [Chlamydiales bacterium]|jgi:hypothetical protein
MRQSLEQQMVFGEVDISKVQISTKSRDDIPQVLLGLQHIYQKQSLRDQVFKELHDHVGKSKNTKTGRPGMDLWHVFVLGTLRLTINCDYDRLVELANNHQTLRQILGHSPFNEEEYQLQTVKDNVRILTQEILNKINTLVVNAAHAFFKKK